MVATDIAPVRTSHTDCEHAASKVARAKCRRERNAPWVPLARDKARKGLTVRVHTDADVLEGTLSGWGAQRLLVRVDGKQRTLATALVRKVEQAA